MTDQEMIQALEQRGEDLPTDEMVQTIVQFIANHPWAGAFVHKGVLDLWHFDRSNGDLLAPEALNEDFSMAMSVCYDALYDLLGGEMVEAEEDQERQLAKATFIVGEQLKHLRSLGLQVRSSTTRVNGDLPVELSYETYFFIQTDHGFEIKIDAFINTDEA